MFNSDGIQHLTFDEILQKLYSSGGKHTNTDQENFTNRMNAAIEKERAAAKAKGQGLNPEGSTSGLYQYRQRI